MELEREFKFDLPEGFNELSAEEQQTHISEKILKEHTEFVSNGFKDYIKPDELDSKLEEVSKAKAEKEAKLATHKKSADEFAASLTSADKTGILLELANLSEEELLDEAKRKEKIQATFKKHENIFKADGAGIIPIIKPAPPEPKEKKKKRFFTQN